MLLIFVVVIAVIAIAVLSVRSAVFTTGDVPEPTDNPRDLDDRFFRE
jgi:hypothetical protein